MHPLVARIHPSYRTGFIAWLFGRGVPWLVVYLTSGSLAPRFNPDGGPLWAGMVAFFELFFDTAWAGVSASIWLPAITTELAMLLATVAVYRFARRDGVPQTAERATWLWAVCPAMVLAPAGSVWALTVALAAMAVAAANTGRGWWSAGLLAAALACRPEAVLVWPGLAAIAWKKKESESGAWAATLVPPLVFSATIFSAVLLGWEGSLNVLRTDAAWRTEFVWNGWQDHVNDAGVLGVFVVLLLLSLKSAGRHPRPWILMILPCLIWPFLQVPASAGAVVLLLGTPVFVVLAKFAENPSRERPLLAGCIVALVALTLVSW